ncbi:MAG TPA: hypothetical protein VEI03_09320 [Stellaceae bacterium]|nr:hypothetical protein [Stellaceae bacterium]
MANHTANVSRLLPAAAAALVMLLPAGETASANSASDDPFGDAVQVADARLDTMRGGFSFSSGETVNFGIDVSFKSKETLDGVPQGHHGIVASFTISNKNSTTGQLDPATPLTVSLNGNINTGPVSSTIGSGATNVTTTLTNSGIVTVIQNTTPNTTLQTQQILNVQTTGLIQNALKSGTILIRPLTIFH